MSTLNVVNITGCQSDNYVDTKISIVNANAANNLVTSMVYSLAF